MGRKNLIYTPIYRWKKIKVLFEILLGRGHLRYRGIYAHKRIILKYIFQGIIFFMILTASEYVDNGFKRDGEDRGFQYSAGSVSCS
jgi:hypothetical protein